MPDFIFYLLIIGVTAYWLWSVMRRRRAALASLPGASKGVKRGPVPGYSYLPGESLRFDPSEPLQPGLGHWEPISLETLHAGSRSRLVLSVRASEPLQGAELFTLLKTLAIRIQRKTRAQVVAVRVEEADGEASAVLVLSPDGRGWTGTAKEAELTAELPGREPFRLAA